MVRDDLPRFVAPMLARAGTATDAAGWAYEVKFDGMRAQLRRDRGKLCLRSRPGRACTDAFPELAPLSTGLWGRRLLLDGELVRSWNPRSGTSWAASPTPRGASPSG
jgi:bifunctional non-homologous end joining protein LigD